uniref:Uncharacterized protein n=1 Tax=Setaria italica TaxID=4555 RepID=K3ZBM3_SETIT
MNYLDLFTKFPSSTSFISSFTMHIKVLITVLRARLMHDTFPLVKHKAIWFPYQASNPIYLV